MLSGFPKQIRTTKIDRGHYRIDREDGYSIEVRHSAKGDWYQIGSLRRNNSLRIFQFDMKNGYTSHDQLAASEGV